MHRITYLPAFHILDIEVSGFWRVQDFRTFAANLAAALAAAPGRLPPNSLYNYTDAAIQSQELVAMMQAMAQQVDPGRRVALYTEGRLARMQARRVAAHCPSMAVFDDRPSALAWLVGAEGRRVA